MYFYRDQGVEGVNIYMFVLQYSLHSLISSSSMLLKGLFLSITSRNFCNTGAGGVFAKKGKKPSKGLLKISYE